ncbi:MAG: PD-(D/E)XK nuclease family protein, partial [Anaerolineales bacterium]|nr:PD-(D/E)XK nuclease family protein [Anaerolineales bacterium]
PAVETEPAIENERHQQEGVLFHRLVQQHLIGLPSEKLARLANTPDLRRWWENWQDFRSLADLGSLYPELTLSAPLGEHRLLAKYDLVAVQPDKKVLIFDWKTYRKRPRDEWMATRLQTRVYRALLIQAGAHLNKQTPFQPEKIEMIYWYADFPAEPARFPYTASYYERDWDALTSLATEIAARRDFPLTANEEKCAYCPYRSYCNRGTQAGDMDDIETELSGVEIDFEQIQEIEL